MNGATKANLSPSVFVAIRVSGGCDRRASTSITEATTVWPGNSTPSSDRTELRLPSVPTTYAARSSREPDPSRIVTVTPSASGRSPTTSVS